MSQVQTVVAFSQGRAAANRCRPYMDKATTSFLGACKKIGAEYAALDDSDKKEFREELKLSRSTVRDYAAIASKADEKLAIIEEGGHGHGHLIPPSKNTWIGIVQTKDSVLRKAAKAGLFTDYEVTRESIKRFQKTGQLPAIKRADKKAPPLAGKIKAEIQKAETSINRAVGHISKLRTLMDDNEVTKISGPELRSLQRQVELLYAELAALNPKLLNRALKILQGEV